MKCHYFSDLKKRFFLKKKELLKISCVFLIFSKEISDLEKYKIYLNFFFSKKLNLNFELKNHCILTKNTRTVNRFTAITRSNVKHLIN
jgi:hypothetical protein